MGPREEYFRSMTPESDGLPCVARSARALGVRPGEIGLDEAGRTLPGTGGMSVAPDSMWNLPHHRRPRRMGRGATGPPGDRVFRVVGGDLSAVSLAARPDPRRPDLHAFVEPTEPIPLAEYESALARTRPAWVAVWP